MWGSALTRDISQTRTRAYFLFMELKAPGVSVMPSQKAFGTVPEIQELRELLTGSERCHLPQVTCLGHERTKTRSPFGMTKSGPESSSSAHTHSVKTVH